MEAKQHYSCTCRWMISLHVGRWVGSSSMPSQRWVSLAAMRSVWSWQRQRSSVLIIRASRCAHGIWVGNQPATHLEGKERRKLSLHETLEYNKESNQSSCRTSCASETLSRFQDTGFCNNWKTHKKTNPPLKNKQTNPTNLKKTRPENN